MIYWLYARPRKLDSSYLSNRRLNPAVIRKVYLLETL